MSVIVKRKGVVDVIVTVMDKNLMQHYINIASDLRAHGVNTDLYVGNPKDFGKQIKYADPVMPHLLLLQVRMN